MHTAALDAAVALAGTASGYWQSRAASIAVAVAVGFLIGLDREKRKYAADAPNTAGVRTFTLVALLGAIAALLNSVVMAAVTGTGVLLLTIASYRTVRAKHPGQTTEFALLAITANILVKAAAALFGGGVRFALRLWPSHAAMLVALWGGWMLAGR